MNIKAFARQLEVSTATVSRAFSGKGRINPATRDRIREQARVLGYFPNRQARSMVRGRTDNLALFYDAPCEADYDYYLAELSHGVAGAAAAANMLLQMHAISPETGQHLDRVTEIVQTGAVDGLIIYLKTDWSSVLTDRAEKCNIPYIILDNTRPSKRPIMSIGDAIENVCAEAGAYVRRIGRHQPGFIHGIHDTRKLAGFKTGLGDLADKLVCDPGGISFEDARQAFGRLHRQYPGIDVVLCGNDVLAMGALRGAFERGLKVPGDVAVIGCDDLALARYCTPALTTMRLPKKELGEQAVKMLVSIINNDSMATADPLKCELIIRESA